MIEVCQAAVDGASFYGFLYGWTAGVIVMGLFALLTVK